MKNKVMKKYTTLLSVISAFAVVVLHVNSCFWDFSTEPYWLLANVVEGIFYYAVPVFIMISGANLIDYRERYTTKEFFIKRAKKTLIPFMAWSLIALMYLLITGKMQISELSVVGLIEGFLNSDFMPVYGFFLALFSAYLTFPVLSAIRMENRKSVMKYMIIVSAVLNIAMPSLNRICGFRWNDTLAFVMTGGYVMYAVIGYYIDNYEITKKWRNVIYMGGLLGLLIPIVGTYFLSVNAGELVLSLKSYTNVSTMLYSAAIFLFFKNQEHSAWMQKAYGGLSKIADTTFGIYLVHVYLIMLPEKVLKVNLDNTNILYLIGGTFVVFFGSVLLVKILKKIPLAKEIVP